MLVTVLLKSASLFPYFAYLQELYDIFESNFYALYLNQLKAKSLLLSLFISVKFRCLIVVVWGQKHGINSQKYLITLLLNFPL